MNFTQTARIFAAASLLLTSQAFAQSSDWVLQQDQSQLQFASVKNQTIAELHRFTELSGTIKGNQLTIDIAVASLDTQIPIRNERMQKHLFAMETYPTISATATLNMADYQGMSVGSTQTTTVNLAVTIASVSQTLPAHIQVSQLADGKLLATTTAPILVRASNFNLTDGIDTLKNIAGLNEIDYVVPVTFSVVFAQ